jgi:NADPH:quinone reductase
MSLGKQVVLKLTNPGSSYSFVKSEVDLPELGPLDLLLKHTYISVNLRDVMTSHGIMNPYFGSDILGTEAIGIVEKKGSEVPEAIKEGMRVIYCTPLDGAYADRRIINFNYIMPVPDNIDDQKLIGCFSKSMGAHYLLRKVVNIYANSWIMVTDIASAEGAVIAQEALKHGVKVVGIIDSDEKKQMADIIKPTHLVRLDTENLSTKVLELTEYMGINCVYDTRGGKLFPAFAECVAFCGVFVSLGYTEKPDFALIEPVMETRSMFVIRPRIDIFKSFKNQLVMTSEDVFNSIAAGTTFCPMVNFYNFDDVGAAHADMKSGKLSGAYALKL